MFQTIYSKRIKEKNICFWLYIKYNLPVCLAFFTAVSFSNNEGIFALFLRYYRCMVNKFIHMIRRKNTKLSFKFHLQCFLWHFQFEHYLFLCSLLNTTKKICQFIFCFVLCFLHDLVCYVGIQCSLNIFIFNFLCSISKKIWNTFNSGVYYFFPSSEFIF